ncbi:hypothetical protein [Geodermatophilus sp. SYSU D00815]
MGLRLPTAQVTVLLGADRARREVMAALDESTGRCAGGHGDVQVRRLAAAGDLAQRLAALAGARDAAVVLVDRLTDGLGSAERRAVLAAVRAVAGSGCAVLVDDDDPVAALAVADGALRAGTAGELSVEPVAVPDHLAS